jgi:DMSO/TMAO reductase YedYZ molybdopterin-dependent catalytic subunit
VLLLTLLETCGLRDSAEVVVVRAIDGYGTSLSIGEIEGRDDVMLAYSVDGKSIPGADEGGPGPVRLLLSQDFAGEYNAQQCVKYVYKVEAEAR